MEGWAGQPHHKMPSLWETYNSSLPHPHSQVMRLTPINALDPRHASTGIETACLFHAENTRDYLHASLPVPGSHKQLTNAELWLPGWWYRERCRSSSVGATAAGLWRAGQDEADSGTGPAGSWPLPIPKPLLSYRVRWEDKMT